MTRLGFLRWFKRFLDEKNLQPVAWELTDRAGETHYIDSDVVIEAIYNCPLTEQAGIKNTIVQIDFVNGNVNDYFKHLAGALINR